MVLVDWQAKNSRSSLLLGRILVSQVIQKLTLRSVNEASRHAALMKEAPAFHSSKRGGAV